MIHPTPTAPPFDDPPLASAGPFTGPPIFISGCNRGGTTIVSQLLGAHPEVLNIGRGPFNEGQYIWRRRYPDWSRHRWALAPWRWYLRRDAGAATPAALRFFRGAFSAAMPSRGRMIEKTPANAIRIPLIDRIYPDCCFVHVLRDGRHTTASLIARRVWPVFAPHQWVNAHRIALADLARIDPARVTSVRYEALLADPAATLESICRGCGLRWDREAAAVMIRDANEKVRSPDRRWDELPLTVRKHVLRVITPLQRDLGYPVEL